VKCRFGNALSDTKTLSLSLGKPHFLRPFLECAGIGKRLHVEAIESAKTCNAPRLLLGVYAKNFEAIAFLEATYE
jgi:GNAT superfamily N-acetyltransferase